MAGPTEYFPGALPKGSQTSENSLPITLASDLGSLPTSSAAYTVRLDDAGSGVTYVGEALPGTAASAASWRVKRITESGTPTDTVVEYADGDADFDNIWNDRASLSYS